MQLREAIDYINENITEVISNFIEITPKGSRYSACCPFHNEKTASFMITPAKGMFKCFGCGEGGDSIHFIMKHENVDFIEAVKIGTKKLNVTLDFDKSDFSHEDYKKKESLRIVNRKVAEYYSECLKTSKKAQDYLKKRKHTFDDDFEIGYAPENNTLIEFAKKQGINLSLLEELGLIKKAQNTYDFFRDRVMFPISDKNGKIIGFTGRYIGTNKKAPKYLNSIDSDIFKKGDNLYALNIARGEIHKQDRAYIVEGNLDVKRLHTVGITNTIAPCGTSLTTEQALLLKKYTNKATLIYDGDDAGKSAILRNAEILIKQQFNVMIIPLEKDNDPDDFFTSKKQFEKYKDEHQIDFFFYNVSINESKFKNPSYKSEFIKNITYLLSHYDNSSMHEVYIEELSKAVRPKKAWIDELKQFVNEKGPVEKKSYIPKQVDLAEFDERGFYVDNNCYFFSCKGTPVQRSNFVMSPLFHIESTIDAKRLFEVTNVHGLKKVVEISQKDLGSLASFRIRIESLGNFWWDGCESDLNRLKRWLYEKTETCTEIKQLGWQKHGFYAWGNGIFNEDFIPVDSYGIVKYKNSSYYIPAFSRIYEKEDNLFEFERRFINFESNISLQEYVQKYVQVNGNNGKIAFCFYLASLFRDIIVRKFEKFPMLNMFGPKGSGKNACAEALLHLFGNNTRMPNLHNTSKPALADHVATSSNAICGFDEYRNDIEMEKREFLKGLWDGTGRTRMNMDKDKKKETTNVDQGIIICGQQMATADIALFSRFVVLGFSKTEYTEEEKQHYEHLKEINRKGLTHITNRVLRYRNLFREQYAKKVHETSDLMYEKLGTTIIESRVYNNWLMIMAAYTTLHDELELPYEVEEMVQLAVDFMKKQNSVMSKNDDLGQFWKKVEMLANSNLIFEGGDYKISHTDNVIYRHGIRKDEKKTIQFTELKKVLYITTSRIFSLYKRYCNQEGEKPLPESTVQYYLENSKAYICTTKKEPFKKIDPKTGIQETDENNNKKRTSTTALVFHYDKVGIDIERESDNEEYEKEQESVQELFKNVPEDKF